jgi:RsiW-degrading membrane proteinase PrsW (M82 family)
LESSLGAAAFLLAGPIEELAKYAAASSAAGHRHFDEPVDGLVYAAAAALGFATLENLLYMLHGGPGLILMRGPVTTLGHVLFSAPWGYAMAVKRFRGRRGVLRRGLLVGAVLHSVFNLMLSAGGVRGLEWLLIPTGGVMALMWLLANRYYARVGAACAEPRPLGPAPRAPALEDARRG